MNRAPRLRIFDHAFVVGLAVSAFLVSAVLDGAQAAPSPLVDREAPATTTTTTATTTTTVAGAPTWPLTGLPCAPDGAVGLPAIAVKFDAHPSVRTYDGIEQADLVVEELVEGGLTRFIGVFHSAVPGLAGPVRSVRTSDFDLLAGLGSPALAFSGGNDLTVQALYRTSLLPAPPVGWAEAFYRRDPRRRAPHDLEVDLSGLHASVPRQGPPTALLPRSTGPAPAGLPVTTVELPFSPMADLRVDWDAGRAEWIRRDSHGPLTDRTGRSLGWNVVLVLYTDYGHSPYDERSPEAHTLGTGPALLLQAGTATAITWSRVAPDAPFSLIDAAGAPVGLPAGRTLLELEPWHS